MMETMCTEMRLLRDEKLHDQNAYDEEDTHNYFNGIIFNAHFLFMDYFESKLIT